MAQLVLLRGARQLLTLRGPNGVRRGAALNDLGIIEDGSVLIQDRRILSVGPTRRIENLRESRGAAVVSVSGCVVLPGFVDPAMDVNPYENRSSNAASVKRKKTLEFLQETELLIRSSMQHGTLAAQVKVDSERESPAGGLAPLRQLASTESAPATIVRSVRLPQLSSDEAKLIALATRLSALRRRDLIQSVEIVANSEIGADWRFWEILARADLPVNLLWPGGPAAHLRRFLECARPRSVFCPAELAAPELTSLAHSPSIAVFSPSKDLLEERENPSVRKLVEAGGAVALASGYDSKHAPIFSMQMVVALGVLRLRLSAEQAISATTINAAHALGWAGEAGSIEAGKRADLVVLGLSDYREIPRRIGVNQVQMVLRGGEFLVNRKRARAGA